MNERASRLFPLPVMRPKLPEFQNYRERFGAIQERGIFSNHGPQLRELETRFAQLLSVDEDRLVLVSSATAGISLSAMVMGQSEWVAPSWTFSASIAALMLAGKNVVLADVHPETQWVQPAPHSKGSGLLAVAPFGDDPINALGLYWDGPVIVDAAASIGGRGIDPASYPTAMAVVYSLHATKVLGIGEGGIVVASTPEFANDIRARANFGFDSNRVSQSVGGNFKLSEWAAAIGHSAIDGWETEKQEWLSARESVVRIGESVGLRSYFSDLGRISPYWIAELPPTLDNAEAKELLSSLGVESRLWWNRGAHTMPAFQALRKDDLSVTEALARRYLGLPFFRGMQSLDLGRLEEGLLRLLEKHS